jgi:Ca2+/Na+ antiporter
MIFQKYISRILFDEEIYIWDLLIASPMLFIMLIYYLIKYRKEMIEHAEKKTINRKRKRNY